MAGTVVVINQGTNTNVATDSVGGTQYQVIKIDIGGIGTSVLFTGSLTSVGTLNSGTVFNNNGSVQINNGTIEENPSPSINILTFGTIGTVGGSGTFIGTLVAAPGIGKSIYVTAVNRHILAGAAYWDIGFSTGTQGTTIIVTYFPAAMLFSFPFGVNGNITNAPLIYQITGNGGGGTVYFNVQYFIK